MTQPMPGWYPDPSDPAKQIYWDGKAWTQPYAPISAPLPEAPKPKKSDTKTVVIFAGAIALILWIVGSSCSGNAAEEARDELHLPPVRDGKFEFTLLTWDGHGGKLKVVNTGDQSWSYDGDNQKAIDAEGRRFDCSGRSVRDIQPGAEIFDSITCRNGGVPIHHLKVHDSWLSLGADLVLAP